MKKMHSQSQTQHVRPGAGILPVGIGRLGVFWVGTLAETTQKYVLINEGQDSEPQTLLRFFGQLAASSRRVPSNIAGL
jgi:hypothetical protein